MLTEKQILDVDCVILERKDLLIVYKVNGWVCGGIGVEIAHAEKVGRPIFYLTDQSPATAAALIKAAGEAFLLKSQRTME